jgi:hypothetical protein
VSPEIADTGVVGEYVDATEFKFGGLNGGGDLFLIGDVELEHQGIADSRQVTHVRGIARCDDLPVARARANA